jgi:hypothetical protein
MRSEQFLEAEYGTPAHKEMSTVLTNNGYEYLDDGAEASVWAKGESHVIKIIMPETRRAHNKANNIFEHFFTFCQAHQKEPNLPKFYQFNDGTYRKEIDFGGNTYIYMAMERLYPLPKNTLEESIIWALSDEIYNEKTWIEFCEDIFSLDFWSNNKAIKQLKRLSAAQWKKLERLYHILEALRDHNVIHKLGAWDLHTANVMKRRNGDLVVIDPWFTGI